jgi:hypothetical protein
MTGGRRLRVTRIRVTLGVTGEGEGGGQTRNQTMPDVAAGALDVVLVHVGLRTIEVTETLCTRLGCTVAEASAQIKRATDGEPTLLLRAASQQDARKLVSDLRSKGAAARMTATDERWEEPKRPLLGPVEEIRARKRARNPAHTLVALVVLGLVVLILVAIVLSDALDDVIGRHGRVQGELPDGRRGVVEGDW